MTTLTDTGTDTRVADLERTLGKYKSELNNIQKILPLIVTARTELSRPAEGIDGWSVNVPLAGEGGGDLFHFVDFKEDFGLERIIARATTLGHKKRLNQLIKHRRRIGTVFLDVTGHTWGDTILARAYLRDLLQRIPDSLEYRGQVTCGTLERLNNLSYRGDDSMSKMTPFSYSEITTDGNGDAAQLKLVNAGMPLPLIYRAQSKTFDTTIGEKWRETGSMPLGLTPSQDFNVNKTTLARGDIVLMCGDGILEFGKLEQKDYMQDVRKIVSDSPTKPSREIGENIMDYLLTSGSKQHDDVTLGIIRYEGKRKV